MNNISQTKAAGQMVDAIFALDLDPIKMKLMDSKEGHGWTQAEADRHELEYKRFLALRAKFPDEVIAPNTNVDKFWHGHILDTVKYAQDCENVFGYFLHHYPYFGLRGEQDAANLGDAAVRMRRLYEQEFGSAASTAVGASYCCKAADPVAAEAQGASAYCCKAADSVTAATDESAYCCKATVSYCCKTSDSVAAQAQEESAYCCKAAVSYCCKAADSVAAQAPADTAYCCKAADSAATDERDVLAAGVSYCCKATDKVAAHSSQE